MAELAPIDVRHYGETGPVVVVLHGGPGARGGAAGLARLLEADCRVLEPLQRRHGAVTLDVARHVADLAEVAPPRAHVIGHSWGAMLGLSFASRHPQRVRSLALVGCGTYDEASRAAYRRALDARLDHARLAELQHALAEASDPRRAAALFAELGALHGAAMAFEPLEDPADVEADPEGHAETWPDALRLQAEGVEPAAFIAIRAPVRMFHGEHDPHPGPAIRDTLSRFIPQLEYESFARCGHEPWSERHAREPFRTSLRAWLTRQDSAAPEETP